MTDVRPQLTVLPHAHDLPVSWDGRAVTWGPWHDSTQPTHLPEQVCERCGVLGPQRHAFGRRAPVPGETEVVDVEQRLPSGRTYTRQVERPTRAVVDLMAERCTACGSDSVTDMVTREAWLLDADDYGTDGSVPPGTLW